MQMQFTYMSLYYQKESSSHGSLTLYNLFHKQVHISVICQSEMSPPFVEEEEKKSEMGI